MSFYCNAIIWFLDVVPRAASGFTRSLPSLHASFWVSWTTIICCNGRGQNGELSSFAQRTESQSRPRCSSPSATRDLKEAIWTSITTLSCPSYVYCNPPTQLYVTKGSVSYLSFPCFSTVFLFKAYEAILQPQEMVVVSSPGPNMHLASTNSQGGLKKLLHIWFVFWHCMASMSGAFFCTHRSHHSHTSYREIHPRQPHPRPHPDSSLGVWHCIVSIFVFFFGIYQANHISLSLSSQMIQYCSCCPSPSSSPSWWLSSSSSSSSSWFSVFLLHHLSWVDSCKIL